jgi:hypothetical protein
VQFASHSDEAGKITQLTIRFGDTPQSKEIVARRVEPYEPTAEELATYSGRFVSPELETSYRLVVKDGTLVAEHARHDDILLRPVRKDRFAGRILGRIRFERDADGHVTGLRATTGRARNLRFDRRD